MSSQPEPRKQEDDAVEVRATVVQRLLWLLWLVCALCVTALFRPDHELISAAAVLKLPYVGLEATVSSFLYFAPLFLLAIWVYVLLGMDRIRPYLFKERTGGDFLIVLSSAPLAKLIVGSSVFLLLPLLLGYFVYQALPRPEAGFLAATLLVSIAVSLAACLHCAKATRLGWVGFMVVASLAAGLGFWHWVGARGYLANLQRLDLAMMTFNASDLTDVDLTSSVLDDAVLDKAILRRTKFHNALLRRAKITNSDLRGAIFSDATLDNAVLRNVLASAGESEGRTIFSRTKLDRVVLENSQFFRAKFDVEAEGLRISESSFERANLEGAKILASQLANVDFSNAEAHGADFQGSTLQGVMFSGATLTDAGFHRAYIAGADFSHAKLADADFRELNPPRRDGGLTTPQNHLISFAGADLTAARFERANIVNGNFWGSLFERTSFEAAVIANSIFVDPRSLDAASFAGAIICNSSFVQASAAQPSAAKAEPGVVKPGVTYAGAYLKGVSFQGVSLSGADFSRAILEDVTFLNADLANARFDSAVFVGVPARALRPGATACQPPGAGRPAKDVAKCADLPAWKDAQSKVKLYCNTLVGR